MKKQLKPNFRKLVVLMKFYQTLKKEEFMMLRELMV
jgi:hypothetical protein